MFENFREISAGGENVPEVQFHILSWPEMQRYTWKFNSIHQEKIKQNHCSGYLQFDFKTAKGQKSILKITCIYHPCFWYLPPQLQPGLSPRCAGGSANHYLAFQCATHHIIDIYRTSHLSQSVSDLLQLLQPLFISLRLSLLCMQSPPTILVRQINQVHLETNLDQIYWSIQSMFVNPETICIDQSSSPSSQYIDQYQVYLLNAFFPGIFRFLCLKVDLL